MSAQSEWHILVIDDEEDILEVMSLTLRDHGYLVTTARDGPAGITCCHEKSPQIVITDIRMPEMNGIEVLKTVKTINSDIEVIVCTAYGEMDLAVKALQLDASDFITKPISETALHLSLKRAKQRYTSRKKLQDYAAFLEKQAADQAQILHQDKMMSLGRLAASVVHEINNPLSGILNYSRLMSKILTRGDLKEGDLDKFKGYLNLVSTETERCSQIVSSLLAFSRKSPPAMTSVRIQELIDKCRALSQHKLELKDIRLEIVVPANAPLIQADANQIQQCIINLIFNAIDAMPDGGTLRIEIHFSKGASELAIAVSDTGIGIPDEVLPHIYDPFFTTKQDGYGVGLGLSTVYGIIERHKGRIDVRSCSGNGATFTIWLPVA